MDMANGNARSTRMGRPLELRALRLDLQEPAQDQVTTSAQADDDEDTISAVRDDLDEIRQKVNAIMVVMARAK